MCCFSRPIRSVSETEIFARLSKNDKQYLVYSMKLSAKEDLAMILPIPTPSGSPENALRFISLKEYDNFFADLRLGFPEPLPKVATLGRGEAKNGAKKLEVVEVGNFEASFVPTINDFDRLDDRFRLPQGTWDKLPVYAKFGFAVFKLKLGSAKIHPMAFEFPSAQPASLFFPTVHIHDGRVHGKARFDHTLYCQRGVKGDGDSDQLRSWEESPLPAHRFMNVKKAAGLILADEHCYRRTIRGMHDNKDVYV